MGAALQKNPPLFAVEQITSEQQQQKRNIDNLVKQSSSDFPASPVTLKSPPRNIEHCSTPDPVYDVPRAPARPVFESQMFSVFDRESPCDYCHLMSNNCGDSPAVTQQHSTDNSAQSDHEKTVSLTAEEVECLMACTEIIIEHNKLLKHHIKILTSSSSSSCTGYDLTPAVAVDDDDDDDGTECSSCHQLRLQLSQCVPKQSHQLAFKHCHRLLNQLKQLYSEKLAILSDDLATRGCRIKKLEQDVDCAATLRETLELKLRFSKKSNLRLKRKIKLLKKELADCSHEKSKMAFQLRKMMSGANQLLIDNEHLAALNIAQLTDADKMRNKKDCRKRVKFAKYNSPF